MMERIRGKRYLVVEDLGEDANLPLSVHRTRKLAELAASKCWAFVLDVDAKRAYAMAKCYRLPVDETTFADLVTTLAPLLEQWEPKSDAALRKLAERAANAAIAENKAARKCATMSRFGSKEPDAGTRGAA